MTDRIWARVHVLQINHFQQKHNMTFYDVKNRAAQIIAALRLWGVFLIYLLSAFNGDHSDHIEGSNPG